MKTIFLFKKNLLLLLLISSVSWSCETKRNVVSQTPVENKEITPPELVVAAADDIEEEYEVELQPPPPPPSKDYEIFRLVEDMPRFPGCEHLNISKSEKHVNKSPFNNEKAHQKEIVKR